MDNNHVKPTKEELAAQLQAIQAQLDAPEDPTPDPEEDETPADLPEKVTPQEDEIEDIKLDETPEDKEIEVAPQDTPAEEDKPKVPPVEERYKESTKEAQRLYKNNVEMNRAIADANALPEPTTEELIAEYPDWELMDQVQQKLAKKTMISDRRWSVIDQASLAQRSIEEWTDKVDKYTTDPQTLIAHPELEGKESKFKEFAEIKDNQGIPFQILVSAFLHDLQINKPAPKKGKMFEQGSGGPNVIEKPKSDKISLEEASALMKTDYKKYKEYLKANKIEFNL